jgi:hypothetical protein
LHATNAQLIMSTPGMNFAVGQARHDWDADELVRHLHDKLHDNLHPNTAQLSTACDKIAILPLGRLGMMGMLTSLAGTCKK